jgi:hypothetical protein
VNPDQHVYNGRPVTVIRELVVLACDGADDKDH